MNLRPYQREAIDAVISEWEDKGRIAGNCSIRRLASSTRSRGLNAP